MKKCVIITTINNPIKTINIFTKNKEYDLILVGDKKTPAIFDERCIFLDISTQNKLYPKLSKLIPDNHYCRKNLGYLYAIKNKYEIIYETDDDTFPLENFDDCLNFKYAKLIESDAEWLNIFNLFSKEKLIWPRGYPLSLLNKNQNYIFKKNKNKLPSIISGMIEEEPDVDAIFRLIFNKKIKWKNKQKFIISNKNICLFNSQNTFWTDPSVFFCMFLPCTVSFRYCDILRSVIANIILKNKNKNISFVSPNAEQFRNKHDLSCDFESECEMHVSNEFLLRNLSKINFNNIEEIYKFLFDKNIIKRKDLEIIREWMRHF